MRSMKGSEGQVIRTSVKTSRVLTETDGSYHVGVGGVPCRLHMSACLLTVLCYCGAFLCVQSRNTCHVYWKDNESVMGELNEQLQAVHEITDNNNNLQL